MGLHDGLGKESGDESRDWEYLDRRISQLIHEVESDLRSEDERRIRFINAITAVKEQLRLAHEQLAGGKRWINVSEARELRNYARKNTDIRAADETLTDEQKVWRLVYWNLDSMLVDSMSAEDKAELDTLDQQIEDRLQLQSLLEEKLRRDGDDTNKGILALIISSTVGGLISWIIYGNVLPALVGAFMAFLIGLLFIVIVQKNSWASWHFGRRLHKLGVFCGIRLIALLGERFMASAWEIKNKE